MGTRWEGGRLESGPSQRRGEGIWRGEEVTSALRMFLGYESMTEAETEDMEELEWGGTEKVASERGEGQVSAGEE